jgi:hypothetical protein
LNAQLTIRERYRIPDNADASRVSEEIGPPAFLARLQTQFPLDVISVSNVPQELNFSIGFREAFDKALARGCPNDPVVAQFLKASQTQSYYRIFGAELSRNDRDSIEIALTDLVDKPDEIDFLRNQVSAALDWIRSFGDLARAQDQHEQDLQASD